MDMSISANNLANAQEKKSSLGTAWLIWGLAAAFFFIDYMARVAPSVMHRYLQVDFGINEAGFATLTAFFYVPYIVMQIPVGLTVDRINIRYLLTVMAIVTAVGCVIFGMSSSLAMASFARVTIGFSAAFAFTSALRLATSWFPPKMLGMLAGLTQALGMLGACAGQAPLSFLVSGIGWRGGMYFIAIIFIILSVLLYLYVEDSPISGKDTCKAKNKENYTVWRSLATVLSNRQAWLNALYAGFLYGPSTVIGESLGPAYLQYGRGMSEHAAAFAVSLIFVGWVFGGPLAGFISDRLGKRKPCMLASAVFGLFFTCIFVFSKNLSPNMIYTIFFLFGLTNSGVVISYALATEINKVWVVGTAIAFTNMLSIFVGAFLQPIIGYMVDYISAGRGYDVSSLLLSDFQFGLKILPISSLIACILALFVKETYCKPVDNL